MNNIVAEDKELQQDEIALKKAEVAKLQKQLQDVESEQARTKFHALHNKVSTWA